MRVCLITVGSSIHAKRWAEGLAAAGCEIHLISSVPGNIREVTFHQVQIYARNPFRHILNTIKVRRLIRQLNPDVIHLFGLFPLFSLIGMLLLRKYQNVLVSVWGSDIIPAEVREKFKDKIIKRILLRHARRFTATSEYLAKETKIYSKKGTECFIIPWGVELDIFTSRKNENKTGRVIVGFAKKLYSLSGPDILLKAFFNANKAASKDLILRIAGNGPMEEELRDLANSLGIASQIEWMGWIEDRGAQSEFYSSIDIMVMPSRRESFGVSAVEALASGVPVIASRYGGIPEIIKEGKNGYLVNSEDVQGFGEAIAKLANDDVLRKKMGIEGRKYAEAQFNWNDSVKRMIKCYESFTH